MKTQGKRSTSETPERRKNREAYSNKAVNSRQAKESSDIYQKFTDLIIEKLEQCVIPWKQPWHEMGLPSNYLTKKPYKGINLWLLLSCGHQYPYYLTFKQANSLGGKIKKGAKALPICYWNFVFRDKMTGKTIPESKLDFYDLKQVGRSGILREFKGFPIEQIEGIDWEFPEASLKTQLLENEACQKIYAEMVRPPELIHQGSMAYYRTDLDQITMPERKLFPSSEAYFGVLYHELCHATGHSSRLNRTEITKPHSFSDSGYAREELLAEMGAGYLNNYTGILDQNLLENSAAYIQSWLKELRNDKHLLIDAASKAQKAVDYILNACPF